MNYLYNYNSHLGMDDIYQELCIVIYFVSTCNLTGDFERDLSFRKLTSQYKTDYFLRLLFGVLRISPCSPAGGYLRYFEFAYSSTQTICLLLYRYLFEGCYFGAITGSVKIAKIKCL